MLSAGESLSRCLSCKTGDERERDRDRGRETETEAERRREREAGREPDHRLSPQEESPAGRGLGTRRAER